MSSFAETGLSARTLAALGRQSIDVPVQVQEEALPAILDGRDVVMQAPTGSGKTLAYLLPLVERIQGDAPGPRALVVTPTRELAIQVAGVLDSLDHGVNAAVLYGGVGYATQTAALKAAPGVVVGTPGRILDMIGRRLLSLSRVEYLVLDEADEMLDAGFAPDVERILALTYDPQAVLASATMPEWVTRVIQRFLHDPVHVRVQPPEEDVLEHGLLRVEGHAKLATLATVLRNLSGSAIVFGRTRHGVRKLNRDLRRLGVDCAELQGDLSQVQRDRTMAAFREHRVKVLVATNVAARGLDITHVDLVVNAELPESPDWLTHRIGRTARMGRRGWALTLLGPDDHHAWRKLRRLGAPDLPEVDGEHLLREGGWRYVPRTAAADTPHTDGRGRRASAQHRRWRGSGRRGDRRPRRPNSTT